MQSWTEILTGTATNKPDSSLLSWAPTQRTTLTSISRTQTLLPPQQAAPTPLPPGMQIVTTRDFVYHLFSRAGTTISFSDQTTSIATTLPTRHHRFQAARLSCVRVQDPRTINSCLLCLKKLELLKNQTELLSYIHLALGRRLPTTEIPSRTILQRALNSKHHHLSKLLKDDPPTAPLPKQRHLLHETPQRSSTLLKDLPYSQLALCRQLPEMRGNPLRDVVVPQTLLHPNEHEKLLERNPVNLLLELHPLKPLAQKEAVHPRSRSST